MDFQAVPQPAPDLAPVERQLEQLTAAVEQLTAKMEAAPAAPARTNIEPAHAAVEIDEAALARAIERAEQQRVAQRLAKMSDDELLAEARRKGNDDADAARAALQAMLARPLSAEKRAGALTELGILERQAGDLAASERSLQEVVDSQGADTEAGAWAAYQLVWTAQHAGRPERALEYARAVANSPQTNESLRIHGLWMVGCLTHDLGQSAQARTALQKVLDQCGNSTAYANIVADVQRRLSALQ